MCKIFGVQGKSTTYKAEWNNINLFNNKPELEQFMIYSKQDSISLLDSIIKARALYLEKYNVDIAKTLSTSSLSLIIYRHKFQKDSIPTLTRDLDTIIRSSYYGGSSDYYKLHGKILKYYDVNSLYPFVMMNDMPLDFIGEVDGKNIKLKDCFGFLEVIVRCPDNIKTPLLLHRHDGKVMHPKGVWKGVYFSEEIKKVVEYGYSVEIIKAYQFTRHKIFSDYIKHFYDEKKNSTGARRFIAKLHLNTLYGIFGRKINTLKTIIAKKSEIWNIVTKFPVKNIVEIGNDLTLLLVHNNLEFDIINKLNIELDMDLFKQTQNKVKTNVAIASAITAYARMVMMIYKTLPGITVYYTNTDSIFTDKSIPSEYVGLEIGQLKDELDGGYIKEAYFFGIKQYAYIDHENNIKSVFSGIPRNCLTWEEVKLIALKNMVSKIVPDQFYKSLNKMEISIKPKTINILFNSDKLLEGNDYIPTKVNDLEDLKMFKHFLILKIQKTFKNILKNLFKNPSQCYYNITEWWVSLKN